MKGYLERANPMIERLIIDLLIDLPDNLVIIFLYLNYM